VPDEIQTTSLTSATLTTFRVTQRQWLKLGCRIKELHLFGSYLGMVTFKMKKLLEEFVILCLLSFLMGEKCTFILFAELI